MDEYIQLEELLKSQYETYIKNFRNLSYLGSLLTAHCIPDESIKGKEIEVPKDVRNLFVKI